MTAFRLQGSRDGEEIREKQNTRGDRSKIGIYDQFDGKWAYNILRQL
jgi:hypothetical protein